MAFMAGMAHLMYLRSCGCRAFKQDHCTNLLCNALHKCTPKHTLRARYFFKEYDFRIEAFKTELTVRIKLRSYFPQ